MFGLSTLLLCRVTINDVVLRRNTAAGSERLGFYLAGEPCSTLTAAKNPASGQAAAIQAVLRVANNTAHSSLVGLMLEANDKFEPCSGRWCELSCWCSQQLHIGICCCPSQEQSCSQHMQHSTTSQATTQES